MASQSKIEWTDASWNPVAGCSEISEGCRNCYAERLAKRLKAMGNRNYANGFAVTLQPHMLEVPLSWKKPRNIFVNSMSDLFHEKVPLKYIQKIFDVMEQATRHHFQILTKRAERMVELAPHLSWPDHIWMGVTVENQDTMSRIKRLREMPSKVKFLSLEPLIGPLPDLNVKGIDWVIVGGESGPGSRPMNIKWVRQIRAQCLADGVPFFFKQWGGTNKKKAGRQLDGRTWDEMPLRAAVA